jgi:Fe(3+) dicitrate transport protein
MIRLLFTVLLLLECFFACGQFKLSGRVIEKGSGNSVKDVDVYLVEEDLLQKGNFLFDGLQARDYTLIIFGLGYNTVEMQVQLISDTNLVVTLSPLQNQLTEVVIQDQKDEIFAMRRLRAVEGTAIYAGKKSEVVRLEKMMGNLAANNSRQIYAQVAGLNIYEGNDGGLQLAIGGRGLDPNRTANFNTRQNGYDISADVLGYPESYYTPPAEALDEIQIIRGAASLQYGTQFGGLINFKTHSIPESKNFELISNQTLGSFGFFNSYNYLGARQGKWTFNGYFNYKSGNGYRPNSKFNARNFFASAKYQFNSKTSLKLETTFFNYLAQQAGGLTDEEFESNPRQSNRTRNWFDVDWKLYNAYLQHKFTSRSELSISLFALDASRFALGYRGNPIDPNQNPITAIDEQNALGEYISPRDLIKGNFTNYGTEVRFLTRYQIKNKNAVWLIGTKYYQAQNTAIQAAGSSAKDADFKFRNDSYPDYPNQSSFIFPNRNFSVFSEHIFYLSNKLSVTPGVRFEHIKTESMGTYSVVQYDIAGNPISNIVFEEAQSFPRNFALWGIGLSYKPSDLINGFANISQNYRSVTFSDIRTINPTFIIDPEISDERGFTSDIGIRGKWKNILSFEAGLYSIFYNDRIGIILDDRANRVRKNIGNAIIYGLESLVEVNLLPSSEQSSLRWFSNFALTDSRYTSSEENNVIGKKVEFIPLVNLKTGINAGYRNMTTNLQFTYLSTQFTDVQNSLSRESGDSRSGIIGEIPSYSILDWSLAYKFKKFTINSGINNILNTSYFTRRATGYPGPGILPSDGRSFFFTLGINL